MLQHVGACGFFLWVDPPMCNRAKEVIPGLLKKTSMLEEKLKLQRAKAKWLITMLVLTWVFVFGLYFM